MSRPRDLVDIAFLATFILATAVLAVVFAAGVGAGYLLWG